MAKIVRFLFICKRVVLGQKELDLRSDELKTIFVDIETIVIFTWTFVGVDKYIKLRGVIIDNWIDLQNAGVLVIPNDGYGKFWEISNPPIV